MITFKAKDFYYTNGKDRVEGECLSTDTKPTQYANGSVLIEMDTGDRFMFDEANGEWLNITNPGGGGDAEVWLVGDTGTEAGSKMTFTLSNVDGTDHITELFNNSSDYILYINDDTELTFNEEYSDEASKLWADSALTVSISVAQGEAMAVFEDASTAPASVEVSVKAK